uniref:VWFD domain-containing protein n=1 Tax=Electrophorus electricus TaxID=8005 RepID=A0AAY5F3D3_ELEEL
GKEFALSFMQNYKPGNNAGETRLMVEVSSPPGAILSTKVKVTALGKVFEKTLQPGAGESFQLPNEVEMTGSIKSKQTVRVEADQEILVLSLNFKTYSADTSVIYPVKDWGTEYYIYTPKMGPPDTFKEFSVTNQGIQNTVEIQLMGAVKFQGQQYQKGSKFTIDLEPFESVQIQSNEDLTGSKISAKQPVAVFTGHSCTWYFSDCNHVYEQLLPVSSWGTAFSVATLAYLQPPFRFDTVIIQASQKTQVKIINQDGPGSPMPMVPGETLSINIPYPNSLQITADKGIQVLYEFNGGANQNGVLNDPFLITILSTDRWATSYTMDGQASFTNEAIIIARTKDVGKLTLDESPISKDLQWTQVAKSEYSWSQFMYGDGSGFNQVAHPDSPFALYSFGVSSENGYGSPDKQSSVGTCWVMGDPHYRTFDGTYYNFMGNCTYIMAKNCHTDTVHPAFEIQAENEHLGSTKAISVSKVIINPNTNQIIVKYLKLKINTVDSLWYLPISLANGRVTLQQSGFSVVMETDFGLSVQYDWEQYMVVKVPASFMGRMCGMCGNFNGKKDDDLTTPSGSLAASIPALGKSWRVPGLPGEAYCTDDCTGQCNVCNGESWIERLEAESFCQLVTLLTDGPLRDCKSLIDPKVFYENCLFDYCMGKGYKKFLCKTAQIYTDACQRAGIHVHDWRNLIGCPEPKCPANSNFDSCACPATCENPSPPADCKTKCVASCTCNDGFLWSGNTCVPKNQCGCIYSNGGQKRYLRAGESIWADTTCSTKCTCNSGQVVCEKASCPDGSECSIVEGIRGCHPVSHAICNIYGDPHYNTFDNSTYNFQGTCTYTVAQGCHLEGTHLTPFAVIVENEKWTEIHVNPSVSAAKVVVVEVYGMILVLRRNQLHQVMVNGILANIPVSLDDGKVKVQQEGVENVILTDFGLIVTYDMVYHVTITVPSSYHGKTCGLCGNFNGNKNDDFLLPDGKETKDVKTFGAAWKVPVPGVVCDDGCSGDVCPKCPENKKLVFEKDCSTIINPLGPFAACHNVINPESYFRDCVYDICMSDGDNNTICNSIAAYMTDCQNFGVTVKHWRTPTFSLKCPANSHYEICAGSCDTPCPGLTEIIKCNIQTCFEGCMCDSGFFNNGTGCVKADQCSCYENGHTYKIGESVITKDCQERLTCLASGVIKHDTMTCGNNEDCVNKNGVLGCYPKPNGYSHSYSQSFLLLQISNSLWYLPISLANGRATLWQSGLSLVMETDFGLLVQYDWEQYLLVKVPASFMGKMCGMCGNFNGKKDDDLTTPSGSLATSIPALGKSWRVPGLPGEAYCTDDCTGQCNVCNGESWIERLEAESFCQLVTLLTDGPLRDCKSLIDPKVFYENCLFDYCMGKGYKKFLCKTAQIYTDACQRAGIHVHDWRNLIGCPEPKCPANSHFDSCACPATCENPSPPADCKTKCVASCTCNDGFLWSGNTCVPKNQCGCIYSNGGQKRYLRAGESIWADTTCSTKCTCNSGQVVCEKASCPDGSECSIVEGIRGCHPVSHAICNIYGDPHYNTFDNSTYNFQGTCTYTVAQGCHLEGTHLTPFAVIVENEKWTEIHVNPSVSAAKVVVVEVYGMILVLRRNQLHQVMVNGILANIPVSLDDGKVKVQQEGVENVILTDFGLIVTYDMVYHVTITVPSSYHGKTCGLCGNFNGNKNDDFLLPDGKETKDVKTFGAAWKVPVPGVVCDDGCSGDVCPKCPENKKLVFEKDCSTIINPLGPFAACHNVINPESYFRDCVYDICMSDGDNNTICNSIAAYMTDCQNFGVTVKHWRTPTFCPLKCPANSHYEICAGSCDTPCPGLTEIIKCNIQTCFEGCMCDSGFFNNGTGCVKADQCSCYENGHTYKSVITKDCQEHLTCLASGVIKHDTMTCGNNEDCVNKNGVLGCYPKPNGTCWVMGDPHYRTFDGDYYNFMGNCTYIVAKNCHPDKEHPEFEVQAMNERFGSTKGTYVSEVIIKVYGQTITIVQHETGLVRISNSLWYLPISLANGRATLWQSGLSLVMETDFGLLVQYDWEQYLLVKVPASFMGKMCGMCGNFNGKKDDDLTTPSGSLATSIPALGKSWRVPGLPGEAYCTDDCTGQCNVCNGESWIERLEAESFCQLVTLLTDGPLRDCKSLIDPKVFYENCLFDYCMGKGYKKFLCKTAQIYTDACQQAGIHVHDWRNIIGCPAPKCPANSHFDSCACPATCESPNAPADCKTNCVEACTCNDGFLWSGNKCVPKNQCGCIYSNGGQKRYLQAGESIWDGDNCSKKCTCNPTNGHVICNSVSCPSGTTCMVANGIRECHAVSQATCTIYGDPHYITFDNSTYDFQGTCTYTVAQGCHLEGTHLTPFAVIVENEKWTEIKENPNVSVNGVIVNIPISLDDGKITVQQVGFQNVITTDFGLIISYDMIYHVTITVPSSYLGKTCGMCGYYNGNKNDEFLLPDGKETKDVKTFGAAWKVPVPGVVCDDGCSGDVCPKCPENKKLVFEKDCSTIINPLGPFAACHNVINPESYFRDCVFDVCMGDRDHDMLCHIITTYMTNCQNLGVTVENWRTPTFCPLKCPANSHYEICAGSCDTPCPGLREIVSCNIQTCFEGCMCNAGFFTNGSGCVKADQCSCYENGLTYKVSYICVFIVLFKSLCDLQLFLLLHKGNYKSLTKENIKFNVKINIKLFGQ